MLRKEVTETTYTVYYVWGCIQPSTKLEDINFEECTPPDESFSQVLAEKSKSQEPLVDDADTIWLAARRGDERAICSLAGKMEDINTLEPIVAGDYKSGRSALYWACLCGHLECVKTLLDLGAVDADGSAFQAATCSEPVRAKSDDRDILFDPDANMFSDFVDRVTTSLTDGSDRVSMQIRALLTSHRAGGILPPPKTVFDRSSAHCCVCFESFSKRPSAVCSPCGHSASCFECLTKIHQARMGCPECRSHIREIINVAG